MNEMTERQLAKWIGELVDKAGSQLALATKLRISPQYLNDVLKDRRKPGPNFLKALGLRKVILYKGLHE